MSTAKIRRRAFLSRTAAASSIALPAVLGTPGGSFAADDRLVMGIIGAGGRGRRVMTRHQQIGVQFAAVCDVYEPNRRKALEQAGKGAQEYTDYRKLLDRKDIDAVLIGTPEHWHAPMLIDAVQAGKDAYCEKPMSHSIEEGVRMVDAVRKTDRIVQIGMQRRSAPAVLEARGLLKECGEVFRVEAYWNWSVFRTLNNEPIAGKLDWDAWLGPAPKRPLEPKRFRYWRFFWDYSGGACADQGTHLMDVVQWFMDAKTPREASCIGRLYSMRGAETPDVFSAAYDYGKFVGSWSLDYACAMDNGWNIRFLGREATLWLDNQGARLYRTAKHPGFGRAEKNHLVKEISRPLSDQEHVANFVECCRTRAEPNAPVEVGHRAVCAPHLANVALRAGGRAKLDEAGRKVSV